MRDFTGMYCCLATPEKTVLTALLIWFVANLNSPIPRDAYDALWAASGVPSGFRKDDAMGMMGLYETVIVIPDEPPVPAVGIADLSAWLAFEAWAASGGTACSDGCAAWEWWTLV